MSSPFALQRLVDDGVVDEVLRQIKSGKEADVFLVRKGEGLLAAKVYKARDERNFKNNAGYREGRAVRNSRDARAMAKGSRYGRQREEQAWKNAEVDALYKLAAAGVRVPAPDIFYEGVLVMELVVDAEGRPAPRLADLRFAAADAVALYTELLGQTATMLTCDVIHGDLSAFNVLLGHRGPTIIDLPQAVSAAGNPQAERFFRRDVRNLHQFFASFAPVLAGRPDGGAHLWRRYCQQELHPGYVPDLATLTDDTPAPGFEPRHGARQQGQGHHPPTASARGTPQRKPPDASPRPNPRGQSGHPNAQRSPGRKALPNPGGPKGHPNAHRPSDGTARPAAAGGRPGKNPSRRRRRRNNYRRG